MIIIQEVHQVIGKQELLFEDSYRDVYLPKVGEDPATRLLLFGWAPHGAGQGYEAVTITAAADFAAWDRHVERTRYGDLGEWATSVDAMRYELTVSLSVTEPWSPLAGKNLNDITSSAVDRDPVVFRLDTIAPVDPTAASKKLEGASAGADTSLLQLAGVWSSALGELDGGALSALYHVASLERLHDVLDAQDPQLVWPGSLIHAAQLDDAPMRTRLLRTARWSPAI